MVLLSLFKRAAAHWQIWQCLRLNLVLIFPRVEQKCNLKNIFSQFFTEWSSGVWLVFGQPGKREGGTEGVLVTSNGIIQFIIPMESNSSVCTALLFPPSSFNRIHCELHLGRKLEAGC